jgi:hypothetical protein
VPLTGTYPGGSAFTLRLTARTKRINLYKNGPLASLDLATLAAAPALEVFEMAGTDPVRVDSLAHLAACPNLTNLTLVIPAATDLSPLAALPKLRALHLKLTGPEPCQLEQLGPVESLFVLQRGDPPPLDLAPLAGRGITRLSLDGVTATRLSLTWAERGLESFTVTGALQLTELELPPFAGTALEYFHIQNCPALATLSLEPFASSDIRRLSIYGTAIGELDLAPLATCTSLEHLQFLVSRGYQLDLRPLVGLEKLTSLQIDREGYISDGPRGMTTSPAMSRWFDALDAESRD